MTVAARLVLVTVLALSPLGALAQDSVDRIDSSISAPITTARWLSSTGCRLAR